MVADASARLRRKTLHDGNLRLAPALLPGPLVFRYLSLLAWSMMRRFSL